MRTSIPVNIDALRPMIRSLVVERFKIAIHTEERPVNTYVLSATGPKLKPADDCGIRRMLVVARGLGVAAALYMDGGLRVDGGAARGRGADAPVEPAAVSRRNRAGEGYPDRTRAETATSDRLSREPGSALRMGEIFIVVP